MPPAQPPALSSAPVRAASVCGKVSRTLVWALTVAIIVLLLPVLLLDAPRKPPAPSVTENAWLEFVSPEFATIVFDEAPALAIPLGLIRPVPTDNDEYDAALTTDDETEEPEPVLPPATDPLRWLDGRAPPLRSTVGPNHLQYKLDPDFGLENRTLRLNGMMIRLRVEF